MKKKYFILFLALALAVSLCLAVFAGCTGDKYAVTVNGGTGGGDYDAGSSCTVTAELDENEVFVKWTNAFGETVSEDNPYVFTVENNTALIAVTKTVTPPPDEEVPLPPPAQKYSVVIEGGVITGTELTEADCEEGATVSVTALETKAKTFLHWLVNDRDVVETNPYSFTLEADISLKAVFDEVCLISVSGGTVDGEKSAKIALGEQCTITADQPESGLAFKCWYVIDENGEEIEFSKDNPCTFDVTESEKYYVKYSKLFAVTVTGGYFNGEIGLTSIEVVEGNGCTVYLDDSQIPPDKGFIGWKIDGTIVSTAQEYEITNVTEALTVEAAYGKLLNVTVTGGYFNGDDTLTTVTVVEGNGCTVHLDYDQIPPSKGFIGWKIGGTIVSTAQEYEITNVTEALTVEAAYDNIVSTFITPEMSANQMLKWENTSYRALAIDRGSNGTVFTANAEYVIFYMYTTPYADKEDYVGAFMMDLKGETDVTGYKNTEGYRFATLEGGTLWELESNRKGNAWLDSVNGFHDNGRQNLGKIFKGALGDKYSAQTPYYLAAQVFGLKGSIYAPSAVSEIGPMAFIEDASVAACTVTVENGVITGTQLASATLYAGQEVSVTFTANLEAGQTFRYWLINGVKGSEGQTAVVTVTSNTTIVGLIGIECDITVNNGSIGGATGTTASVMAGDECTITATEDAENVFAYWYVLDESNKEKGVSDKAEYTFTVTKSETYYVKYVKELTVLSTPDMAGNAMFKHNDNYSLLELDRGASGTAFTEGVDYVKFYVYTSTTADKSKPVAEFIMDNNTVTGHAFNFRLASVDGKTLLHIEGRPKPDGSGMGNCWVQTEVQPDGQRYSANYFFEIFKEIIGAEYDSEQEYFLAAQKVAVKYSGYADSEISDIGTMAFKGN